MFVLRLTWSLDSLGETYIFAPGSKREAAFKGLVCPIMDYGSSVWEPPGVVLQEELESVLKRAARFVTGSYSYETGSMTGILGQLKWESLKKRRKDNRLILLYKGLKGKASVPTDDLIPNTRRGRNQHSMAFQTPIANTDVYKGSFFPRTIRDWNALPDSLISSAEDADGALLSSLLWWELGTNFLITGPGEWLSFRHFTSKLLILIMTCSPRGVVVHMQICRYWTTSPYDLFRKDYKSHPKERKRCVNVFKAGYNFVLLEVTCSPRGLGVSHANFWNLKVFNIAEE